MSRAVPVNRLDQAVEERAKALFREGLSYRSMQHVLELEGEKVSISTLHGICKGLERATDAPAPADATAELATGLEVAAAESEDGVAAIKAALIAAAEAGNVETMTALAKSLQAMAATRDREIKSGLLLRGKATSRSASVIEPAEPPVGEDAARALRLLDDGETTAEAKTA